MGLSNVFEPILNNYQEFEQRDNIIFLFIDSKDISFQINEAVSLLHCIYENGEQSLLYFGDELFSKVIINFADELLQKIKISISFLDGFIEKESQISVSATDSRGNPINGIVLTANWYFIDLFNNEKMQKTADFKQNIRHICAPVMVFPSL